MHNHYKKIAQALQRGELKTGELTRLNVYHDDTCDLVKRAGECNCDPVLEVEEKDGEKREL